MKTYPGEFSYHDIGRGAERYVSTGEHRNPRKGEFYLSGAIPCAYRAPADLDSPYHIVRPVTVAENTCPHCHQTLRSKQP